MVWTLPRPAGSAGDRYRFDEPFQFQEPEAAIHTTARKAGIDEECRAKEIGQEFFHGVDLNGAP